MIITRKHRNIIRNSQEKINNIINISAKMKTKRKLFEKHMENTHENPMDNKGVPMENHRKTIQQT